MKAIKDFFINLVEGKPRLKIEIQKLYYLYVESKDKQAILLEPVPYPSTYQAMVGVQNLSRRRISIKDVKLEVHGQDFPCINLTGIEFGPHDYKQLLWIFPVNYQQGIKSGRFSLTVIDSFDNVFVRQGRFPIGTRVGQILREPI
ncbi:MAG: hypothetical protein OEZ20_03815 [candidate division WOR-3 bacterium]|nr:hypothetical protein [candidate division WOR-3 bacterium]MDH5683573.1 hypothetical protein [candidate division WOR-3 bacterium]